MVVRPLKKVIKILTSSRQRLLVLTLTLLILLVASTGALIAHQVVSSLPDTAQSQYKSIPLLANQGQLIIGIEADQPPFSYKLNDQQVGYNIDLARALGLEIGLPVTFKVIDTSKLDAQAEADSQLNQGLIHLIISNTTVTGSRQQNFNLSQPYLTVSQVGLNLKGQPLLNNSNQMSGKIIGTLEHSLAAEYAQTKTDPSKVVVVKNTDQLIGSLTNGQADLVLIDLPTANKLVNDNTRLQVATNSLVEEPYSIVTAKQQWQLANLVNNSLAALNQKGVSQSLQQKWLR